MPVGLFSRLAVVVTAVAILTTGIASRSVAQEVQSSYDVIRVADASGVAIPYVLWVDWTPTIVTTPDGGAWAFFSAQPFGTEGASFRGRLYASRFSPETNTWQPATVIPGGEIQFGATAVVDGEGGVHLMYSDRASVEDTEFSTLFYTRSNAEGRWETPVAVAPFDTVGHQLNPSLALDDNGGLHAVWQDQRGVPEELRVPQAESSTANAAYADIYSSDLVDGAWTEPVQVNVRGDNNEVNASRPHFTRDGERLVAVWSVYEGVSTEQLSGAIRIEWSTRPLGENAWAEPKVFLEPNGTQIGGRLVQIAPVSGGGGVVALVGRRTQDDTATEDEDESTNELFMRRLETGAGDWGSEVPLSTGEKGAFPAVAIAPDGTIYAVYENGAGAQVDVGAFAIAPGADTPGPDTIISPAEAGAQGRPSVTVDATGSVWIIYFHQPESGSPVEARILRGATIPSA